MKRFWKDVSIEQVESGWNVLLDGRTLKTPKGRPQTLPNKMLAEAVAAEWRAVEDDVKPDLMPQTGFANAAIDIISDIQPDFAADLARYAEGDMLYYRAESPEPLVERQKEQWDPILDWASQRYDINFSITTGVIHVEQPAPTIERLAAAISALPPFALAALSPLVSLSGSAIIPLALCENAVDEDSAWQATILDEQFQAELWGEDYLAQESRENRRQQFSAALLFLQAALAG